MATNRIRPNGRNILMACTHPALPVSGNMCRIGTLTGVVQTDENAAAMSTVDFGPAVYELSVKGENDGGDSAVIVGAQLFYVDADVADGTGYLNKKVSGNFFGFALETVDSSSTSDIMVLIMPSPGPGTLDFGDDTIGTAELQDDALAADATGRAIMATDFFNVATALDKFAADSWDNTFLLDAVANNAFAANANTRALFADGIWTGIYFADNALGATTTGRAIIATDYFNLATALDKFAADSWNNAFLVDAIEDNAFAANANTRALFANGIWTGIYFADNALDATAGGRAIITAGYFDVATALDKFETDSWDATFLLDAIEDGAFAATADTRALFGAGIWEDTYLATNSVTADKVLGGILNAVKIAVLADAAVIGGIPIVYRITLPDASTDTDVTITYKTTITDIWFVKTDATGAGGASTLIVKNTAAVITDTMDIQVGDEAIVRASTIDSANSTIAAGGILRCTTVDSDNTQGEVYVMGHREA